MVRRAPPGRGPTAGMGLTRNPDLVLRFIDSGRGLARGPLPFAQPPVGHCRGFFPPAGYSAAKPKMHSRLRVGDEEP